MKLTKETVHSLIKAAKEEQERAVASINKQQGAINLCEWLLKMVDFDSEIEKKEGEKAA